MGFYVRHVAFVLNLQAGSRCEVHEFFRVGNCILHFSLQYPSVSNQLLFHAPHILSRTYRKMQNAITTSDRFMRQWPIRGGNAKHHPT